MRLAIPQAAIREKTSLDPMERGAAPLLLVAAGAPVVEEPDDEDGLVLEAEDALLELVADVLLGELDVGAGAARRRA